MKKKYTLSIAVCWMLFCSISMLQAQLSFSNQSALLNKTVYSGGPVFVADMNGDFLDDIVSLNQTSNLAVEYQNQDGTFSLNDYDITVSGSWGMTVADIDNNGSCEIISGGYGPSIDFVELLPNGSASKSVLPNSDIFVQGINFVDVNNDGFVDVFSCNDDGPNRIWGNNKNNSFDYTGDNWVDFSLYDGIEQNAGNYGSVWTDFDRDGDLDLYLAKCRQGVNSPSDVRRINQLWVNDGNNNFTEGAVDYNLAIGWQSWTAEFQDIDNDGDFDCFITNHDHESQLLENIDNNFVDITASSGISLNGLPVQASMKDFDNDGFVDLLTTNGIYRNNGDKTFVPVIIDDITNQVTSFGLGDLNHDGFIDIYAVYSSGFNGSGSQEDQLILNDGNDNNFLAVNLIGQISNRNGIGALLELHGDWGVMIREVRAGESYGIGHSFTQHFGLGSHEEITSLTIHWPSGIIDVIENPTINEFLTITENNCTQPNASISANGTTNLCEGESVLLSAPDGFNYSWSNNAATQSILVYESGYYNVTVQDENGCYGISQNIEINVISEEFLEITMEGEQTICEGSSTILTASDALTYNWSTSETTQSIVVTEGGSYNLMAQGYCQELISETIDIALIDAPDAPQSEDVSIPSPGTATLSAIGDNIRWYEQANGGNVLAEGNDFETPFTTYTTTFYAEDAYETTGFIAVGGAEEHTGDSQFSGDTYNGEIIFDSYEEFTLKTVVVYTDLAGIRIIELQNVYGMVLASKEIYIEEGKSTISLDFVVPKDDQLVLTTNLTNNISLFGYESPRLRRTSINGGGIISYPYVVDDVANLVTSNVGNEWYYYFYNWEIQKGNKRCPSERTPAILNIESTATHSLSATDALQVYPNPTDGQLTIEVTAGHAFQYQLMDLSGRSILTQTLHAKNSTWKEVLDLSTYPKGMYWLQFQDQEHTYTTKIVVQ